MINSIIDALQYPFFLRSLVIVILLSLVFPLYGNIVVLRKEANIAHAFAHMGLLGIAICLRFHLPVEWGILGSIIVTIVLIRILSHRDKHSFDAINEILAQLGIVGAILIVSQMVGYRADISSYLFGDILLVSQSDVLILSTTTLVALATYFFTQKRWYATAINEEISLSKKYPLKLSSTLYLIVLGIIIGAAMKIIGVLLVSAFLILPSNIAKIITHNKQQWIKSGIIIAVLFSIFALFLAWHLNFPAGANIIGVLIGLYIVVQFYKIITKKGVNR